MFILEMFQGIFTTQHFVPFVIGRLSIGTNLKSRNECGKWKMQVLQFSSSREMGLVIQLIG